MGGSRSQAVSSTTVIRGSLIGETYTVFRDWDFAQSRAANLRHVRDYNLIGASTARWAGQVTKALSRRFDSEGRDRPLVELAKAGCDHETWKPLLLWHMTRDEFLVRDFFVHWLYPRWVEGTFRLCATDLLPYLKSLSKNPGILLSGEWSDLTTSRVASGLLRIATDFGLLTGKVAKSFASYHLPEASFIYLLHAMADTGMHGRGIVEAEDWHMYLMDSVDVERELLRLHQFQKLHYEVAGSLAQLILPRGSSADYAKELVA